MVEWLAAVASAYGTYEKSKQAKASGGTPGPGGTSISKTAFSGGNFFDKTGQTINLGSGTAYGSRVTRPEVVPYASTQYAADSQADPDPYTLGGTGGPGGQVQQAGAQWMVIGAVLIFGYALMRKG